MALTVDTTDLDLSNREQVMYQRLFEQILRISARPGFRGNISVPFLAVGQYGKLKIEQFVDLGDVPTSTST